MADEQTLPAEQQPATGEQPPATGDERALGPEGEKALSEFKRRAREAEASRRELEAELAKLREASQSETEKAIERARREAAESVRKELTSASARRVLTAEIKAAAGGKLADPLDAVRLLDLDSFTVSDDGDVDSAAIAKSIDELLKTKPYLAANARRFEGGGDGGARTAAPVDVPAGHARLVAGYAASSKS